LPRADTRQTVGLKTMLVRRTFTPGLVPPASVAFEFDNRFYRVRTFDTQEEESIHENSHNRSCSEEETRHIRHQSRLDPEIVEIRLKI
jgi:hypothetical protein